MPEFTYEAMAGTGQRTNGTLSANSEREVVTMLDAKGLFALKIEEARSVGNVRRGGRRVGSRVMATFFSQLADLLRAGVPLLRCIEILERQSTNAALADILREVHAKVADGTTLADALAEFPRAFNELSISMVRAGQEGGFLEDVLERIAHFTEHQEDLKAKVIGALAYPAFLAVTAFVVLMVLVVFFVPMFEPIFKKLDEAGELPLLTQMLIGTSRFIIYYWWIAALIAPVAIAAYWQVTSSEKARLWIDTMRLRLPVAGTVYLNFALSRFTRILGTLLRNGIPILQSLKIAKDSTGNRVLSAAIADAAEHVTAGNKLAIPLATCKYLPRDIVEMISVGEESNQLEKVLLDTADALDRRTGRQLELMIRLLEPMMLLVMAVVILLVVLGLLLPVFKMSRVVKN
ncbi:MAG: type II secretion system F family protein [Planctomycetes bacterium]|nr:type II secretion system F family protein [Planctomycetota bacterium]